MTTLSAIIPVIMKLYVPILAIEEVEKMSYKGELVKLNTVESMVPPVEVVIEYVIVVHTPALGVNGGIILVVVAPDT